MLACLTSGIDAPEDHQRVGLFTAGLAYPLFYNCPPKPGICLQPRVLDLGDIADLIKRGPCARKHGEAF